MQAKALKCQKQQIERQQHINHPTVTPDQHNTHISQPQRQPLNQTNFTFFKSVPNSNSIIFKLFNN